MDLWARDTLPDIILKMVVVTQPYTKLISANLFVIKPRRAFSMPFDYGLISGHLDEHKRSFTFPTVFEDWANVTL